MTYFPDCQHPPTQLSDPKLAQDWWEVKCPTEIEFLIKLRNQRHFGQAEHDKTPFTQEPLHSRLNWSTSTGTADLILEGNYSPNDIDDISQLFLTHCKKATALDSLHHLVSLQDFKSKFTKWSESTSTSPSGRHLGLYKALFAPLARTLDEDTKISIKNYQ